MTKICFLFSNFHLINITGQPSIALEIAKKAAKKHQIFILSNSLENRTFKKKNIKIFLFKGPANLKGYFLNLPKIIKTLRQVKPDIIHVHGSLMIIYYWFLNLVLKIPMVCSLCETPEILKPFYQRLLVFCLKRVKKTFVTSKYIKKQLGKSGLPSSKIQLVRIGLNEKLLLKTRPLKPETDILYFGDGKKNRGFDTIFKLAQKLPGLKFKVLLRWQGKECHQELEEMKKLNHVSIEFLPYSQALKRQILKSKLVILPYRFLGVRPPLSLLEAMALGKCVLTSKMPGNKEVIKNGESGFILNFNKLDEVSKKISFLLENPKKREAIGQKAKETIKKMYTLKEYKKIINFYASL